MIVLTRDYASLTGTHGTFELNGKSYHSLERPDLGNLPYESCIPLGDYDLIPYESPKFGHCFIMVNPDLNVYQFEDSPGRPEKGRFLCLFVHWGNEVDNFQGCIGASNAYDEDRDRLQPSTRRACAAVNAAVPEEGSFKLQIKHQFE